ncbi:hypothetical protein [Streptomyces sp. NPDC058622]|uniref:hypothetical protein n=1 Tax=Streptomyces sp. NPDC058622 TaxID=3346562 RepID=UPI00366783F8
MKAERCDACELIIGEGCCCGVGPPAATRAPLAFVLRVIRISPSGYGHVEGGCNHDVDGSIEDAGWGWVPDPSPGQWAGISEQTPLRASHGSLQCVARRRCRHCAHFLP